jgi:hypothetical protein
MQMLQQVLREEICKAEVFRADFSTFRRDWRAVGGGAFICVKNYISCAEFWVYKDFEMIEVSLKGMDPIYIRGKSQAFTEFRMRTFG